MALRNLKTIIVSIRSKSADFERILMIYKMPSYNESRSENFRFPTYLIGINMKCEENCLLSNVFPFTLPLTATHWEGLTLFPVANSDETLLTVTHI